MPCAFIATSRAPLARPSTNRARNRVARLPATPGSTSVAARSGKPTRITGRLPKRSTGAPATRVPTSRPMARPTSAVPSSPSDSSSDSLIAGSRGAHVPETVEWIRNAAETATRGELSIGAFLRGRPPEPASRARMQPRRPAAFQHRGTRLPATAARLDEPARAPHGTLICGLSSSSHMRLLVVEDDVKMAALVRRGLTEEGAAVDVARSGEDALWMAAAAAYDALVLDVMLPGIDGFETCRRLRGDGVWTPVLLLTARDSVEDRVAGLDGGADDYLTKPFSFAELSARLRALVRRGQKERPAVVEVGELRLDPATRQAWRGKRSVELSTKEFALLEAFMRRPGDVLTRLELLEHAWDFGYENRSNVIDVYVRYLREKIDRPFGVKSIVTVRGAGYRLRADGGGET